MQTSMSRLRSAYLTLQTNPNAMIQAFIPDEAEYLPFRDIGREPAAKLVRSLLEEYKTNGKLIGYTEEKVEGGHKVTIIGAKRAIE